MHTESAEPKSLALELVIGGKYRIESVLGEGGFARVYKARHAKIRQLEYAIKVLKQRQVADREAVERFIREAEMSATLQSPYVVRITDFGETSAGLPYIVMEYVYGITLFDYVQRCGRMKRIEVARVTACVLRALEEAHNKGIVHRDLKPSNVMLLLEPNDEDVVAKVTDFGIAKVVSDAVHGLPESPQTTGGMVFCTPQYASPEVLIGEPTFQSDLYALGHTMAEMLDGRSPFVGMGAFEVANRQMSDTPTEFGAYTRRSQFHDIIQRACAKSTDERYASATEMLHDVERLLERFARTESLGPRPFAAGKSNQEEEASLEGLRQGVVADFGMDAFNPEPPSTPDRDLGGQIETVAGANRASASGPQTTTGKPAGGESESRRSDTFEALTDSMLIELPLDNDGPTTVLPKNGDGPGPTPLVLPPGVRRATSSTRVAPPVPSTPVHASAPRAPASRSRPTDTSATRSTRDASRTRQPTHSPLAVGEDSVAFSGVGPSISELRAQEARAQQAATANVSSKGPSPRGDDAAPGLIVLPSNTSKNTTSRQSAAVKPGDASDASDVTVETKRSVASESAAREDDDALDAILGAHAPRPESSSNNDAPPEQSHERDHERSVGIIVPAATQRVPRIQRPTSRRDVMRAYLIAAIAVVASLLLAVGSLTMSGRIGGGAAAAAQTAFDTQHPRAEPEVLVYASTHVSGNVEFVPERAPNTSRERNVQSAITMAEFYIFAARTAGTAEQARAQNAVPERRVTTSSRERDRGSRVSRNEPAYDPGSGTTPGVFIERYEITVPPTSGRNSHGAATAQSNESARDNRTHGTNTSNEDQSEERRRGPRLPLVHLD